MYLSRIQLDDKLRETMRALSSPHILHGAIEQGFSDKENRKLWRVDWLNNACYLLVLSKETPDFTHIANQFGYPSHQPLWQTKDYNRLISRLQSGQQWHFRLRANPTRNSFKEKNETSGRGKVFAHVTSQQQKEWLLVKAEGCGFNLAEDGFNVVHTQRLSFQKGGNNKHQATIHAAVFEGHLTITEPERFKHTLLFGIGRAKAYGCGLLTIARPSGIEQ